jgi:glycerol-3-phosphate dehydrogenase
LIKVAVVGAGVVGASVARVLTMYEGFEVLLVEREPDVGWGVSKANTSIIHPGHEEDPRQHPLRAKLCVEGNRLWRQWVKELDIPAVWPGELMVFASPEEEREARKYVELAKLNGVPGVRLVYEQGAARARTQRQPPSARRRLRAHRRHDLALRGCDRDRRERGGERGEAAGGDRSAPREG